MVDKDVCMDTAGVFRAPPPSLEKKVLLSVCTDKVNIDFAVLSEMPKNEVKREVPEKKDYLRLGLCFSRPSQTFFSWDLAPIESAWPI